MSRRPSSLRIIVSGLVGLYPVGGVAWDYLQYVIGLARLGHDVWYVEDTWSWPYEPVRRTRTDDPSYTTAFLAEFFERHAPDFVERWRYVHLHETGFGVEDAAWRDVVRTADVFLNVSGASIVPDGLPGRCRTVFLDTDPGYNQIVLAERPAWSENVDRWAEAVMAHDRHLTYAENIHGPDCLVPLVGIDWTPTRMPIVLDLWPVQPVPAGAPWTTVMTWNPFRGPLIYDGREYGAKDVEFERLIDLPARVTVPLAVAIGGVDAPAERLAAHGWDVLDGPATTRTPDDYRHFIARSAGELSPAKEVYVALRTGWFSCRSACYLAAGRPVVVQDTGLEGILPAGEGLLLFRDADEVVARLAAVAADPARHAEAARATAETEFDSARVLTDLLEAVYASESPSPEPVAEVVAR